MMTAEEKAKFKEFCRGKHRCGRIMDMIEAGVELFEIARKFNTSVSTIQVYEKALRGELTRGAVYDTTTGKCLTDEAIMQIGRMYMDGATIDDAAKAFGVNRYQVRRAIDKAAKMGLPVKVRNETRGKTILTKDEKEEVLRRYDMGMTPGEIAAGMEKPYTVIKHFINNYG